MSDLQRPHCLNRAACTAAKPTTHCRRCSIMRVSTDPELEARRVAAIRTRFEDPAYAAAHAQRLLASLAEALKKPGAMEAKREHGRRQYREHLSRPEIRAKAHHPETRKRAAQKASETRLAWCPPAMRAEYKRLIKWQAIPAAEARRIIEAEIVGTAEHGRREVANNILRAQLRHERQIADAY